LNHSELEAQLLDGCRRLAHKGFLNASSDSLSVRIPGTGEMLLTTGRENWRKAGRVTICVKSFISQQDITGLHESIYLERPDVGAIATSSPKGVRLLAKSGSILPPLFDEQVRHIGLPIATPLDEALLSGDLIHRAFAQGANGAVISERLLCLGMTCERAIFNTELFEKCARAYVIAKASGIRARTIPAWVRVIANNRLMKDERSAGKRYLNGQLPESKTAY
jgi:ribulose-5-phosphate 4-epimerase/fuculose-1-phosphate aldolase